MPDNAPTPHSPFKLNRSRIVLLVLGALLVTIILSTLLGGLGNYQQLREAAQDSRTTEQAPSN